MDNIRAAIKYQAEGILSLAVIWSKNLCESTVPSDVLALRFGVGKFEISLFVCVLALRDVIAEAYAQSRLKEKGALFVAGYANLAKYICHAGEAAYPASFSRIWKAYENAESLLTVREKGDLEIITKMYRQQKNHFQSKDCRESIPNRIVSISKPYVRPIVRGKEVKSVEFGAKVNNILVDGISFIEKLSFNAFNEGTRLIHCLKMHKRLFGVDAKKVGGDTGYAGTDNRDYCKENGIQTSFVKRGRPFSEEKKEKDLVKKELARVFSIFFGIHTANVVQLADRIEQRAQLTAA